MQLSRGVKEFVGVFVIPTGLGADLGGHAGDANACAKVIAECCDVLITHPNVVNASDINEMTANMLYVEGSMLDEFMLGRINLNSTRSNKILVLVNKPVGNDTVNAVNAARVTLGADIDIYELPDELVMRGWINEGKAEGSVGGLIHLFRDEELVEVLKKYDAIAIHTEIEVEDSISMAYFLKSNGVNPWGKVEAKVSSAIFKKFKMPCAHAPREREETKKNLELHHIYDNQVVDPRLAPEAVSICFLHSVLKGLHKAPRPILGDDTRGNGKGYSIDDVDFLLSPDIEFGTPHDGALGFEIPIILVMDAGIKDDYDGPLQRNIYRCENYIEAVGIIMCLKTGVNWRELERPPSMARIYEAAVL